MSVVQSTRCDRCLAISPHGAGASQWLHVTCANQAPLDFCSRACAAVFFFGPSGGPIIAGGGIAGGGLGGSGGVFYGPSHQGGAA